MARPRLTDEEKALRAQQRKQEKIAAREAAFKAKQEEWARQAEASRNQILSEMDTDKRDQFLEALNEAPEVNSAFVRDVVHKWQQFGKLTLKQIDSFISAIEREQNREIIAETIENFLTVGSKISAQLSITYVALEHAIVSPYVTHIFTRVRLSSKCGVRYSFKTNNKKLVDIFNKAFDEKRDVKVQATIKYIFDGSDVVALTARGMKVEIIDAPRI